MIEIKKMPIVDLETIIESVDFTKQEIGWIWPIKGFGVY